MKISSPFIKKLFVNTPNQKILGVFGFFCLLLWFVSYIKNIYLFNGLVPLSIIFEAIGFGLFTAILADKIGKPLAFAVMSIILVAAIPSDVFIGVLTKNQAINMGILFLPFIFVGLTIQWVLSREVKHESKENTNPL